MGFQINGCRISAYNLILERTSYALMLSLLSKVGKKFHLYAKKIAINKHSLKYSNKWEKQLEASCLITLQFWHSTTQWKFHGNKS